MKSVTLIMAMLITCGVLFAQEKPENPVVKEATEVPAKVTTTEKGMTKDKAMTKVKAKAETVEAACGMCQFGMKTNGCSMAVKMADGNVYPVDGVDIHDHDAHGKHGMCMTVRKAKVTGELVDGTYKAETFTLLPVEPEKK